MDPDRAVAVLITSTGARNIEVDAREKSPFTHDSLGGTPTFLGTWRECIYMLGLAEPDPNSDYVDSSLIPSTRREPGRLRVPLLFCKLDSEYRPVNFTVEDLSQLTREEES